MVGLWRDQRGKVRQSNLCTYSCCATAVYRKLTVLLSKVTNNHKLKNICHSFWQAEWFAEKNELDEIKKSWIDDVCENIECYNIESRFTKSVTLGSHYHWTGGPPTWKVLVNTGSFDFHQYNHLRLQSWFMLISELTLGPLTDMRHQRFEKYPMLTANLEK